MSRFRRIAGFFARLVAIYALLVIAWPGIKTAYAVVYSAGGNLVFQTLMPWSSIRFHPRVDPTGQFDTRINFANKRTGAEGWILASSRNCGYLQTAFLVSLVLATSLPWRRRLWALLWGLILVNVAVACKLLVILLAGFSHGGFLLKLPPAWEKVLEVGYHLASNDLASLWPVSVFIWILVSFRRTDWQTWLQADTPPAAQRGKRQVGR